MHLLIIYYKKDLRVIAAFETNTILTNMNVLKLPDIGYTVTLERDCMYTHTDGTTRLREKYVREDNK